MEKTFFTPDDSFIKAAPEIEFIFKIEADEPGLRVKIIPRPGRGSNNEIALFLGSCRIKKFIFLNESSAARRLSLDEKTQGLPNRLSVRDRVKSSCVYVVGKYVTPPEDNIVSE